MTKPTSEEILQMRKSRKLHKVAEDRLGLLLAQAFPECVAVPEVSAVLGGRNDLIQFSFTGRCVVFEIFCSVSQVPQDLRLLEQAECEVKIAILIDQDVDKRVSRAYFRKKPNAFPHIWLSRLLDPSWDKIMVARLRELIDEESSVRRLRRLVQTSHGESVERAVLRFLEQIEQRLPSSRSPGAKLPLTGKDILALQVVGLLKQRGIPIEKLRSLFQWLREGTEYATLVVRAGFQAFLVTDLEGRHAIWSDGDLADDLIMGASATSEMRIVVCLNQVINDFFTRVGAEPASLRFHFFHSYAEYIEKVVPSWTKAETEGDATEEPLP